MGGTYFDQSNTFLKDGGERSNFSTSSNIIFRSYFTKGVKFGNAEASLDTIQPS